MFYPTVNEPERTQRMLRAFGGYNHILTPADGEWYDEENLTAEYYPVLAPRPPRRSLSGSFAPVGIGGGSQPAFIAADGELLWNMTHTGLMLDPLTEKQFVSIGAVLVIWPDRKYYNTADGTFGGLDNTVSIPAASLPVRFSPSTAEGDACVVSAVSPIEPESPANGMLWLDTGTSPHTLKQFSGAAGLWSELPETWVKLEAAGIGSGFSAGDGITLSGAAAVGSADLEEQAQTLNGSCQIESVGENWLVIPGILDEAFTQSSGTVLLTRRAPEMDYICEAKNRLWGCRFGMENGKPVNELYASKLGDYKNWTVYAGLSTDSWAAGVGTDGVWTGCAVYEGCPLFFKENAIHKIYISAAGAHQVVTAEARGIQRGCARSAVTVNEVLYYKARDAVCAYTGAMPVSISEAFGELRYHAACAGSLGNRYVVSMKDGSENAVTFTYDTLKQLWHRASGDGAVCFARVDDVLYHQTAAGEIGYRFIGQDPMPEAVSEPAVSWHADTGILGFESPEHKYLTRFRIRLRLPDETGSVCFSIRYDSSGDWVQKARVTGAGLKSVTVPVLPHRCDHLQLRLSGTGPCLVFSLAYIYEDV